MIDNKYYYIYNNELNQLCINPLVLDGYRISFERELFVQVIWNRILVPRYLISSFGRVFDLKREKFLKQFGDKDGYMRVVIDVGDYGKKTVKVHRIQCMSFIPLSNDYNYNDYVVNHQNGNKYNNVNENLEWTTQRENTRHGWRTGLNKNIGENHPLSKTTDEQVHQICKFIDAGLRNNQICDEFNITEKDERMRFSAIISSIRHGKAHISISSQYNFLNGITKVDYSDMFTHILCAILSDDNEYTYKEVADMLEINQNDRVYFKNYVDNVIHGDTAKNIAAMYPGLKRPLEGRSEYDYLY